MTEELTREWAKDSLMCYVSSHESICEKMREIYDLVHELPESKIKGDITEKLIDALIMGKKMQARLFYYKDHYLGDTTGNDGRNLKEITDYEERRCRRNQRVSVG